MKRQAKNYAQLTETMTPEPQQLDAEEQDPPLNGGPTISIQGSISESSSSSVRKESQSSQLSQTSTCLVSTTESGDQNSPGSSMVCSQADQSGHKSPRDRLSNRKGLLRRLVRGRKGNLTDGSPAGNLNRSISQSMLELDESENHDGFELRWDSLSFAYRQPLLSRLICHLRGSERKQRQGLVLDDLSGKIHNNQLVAIIGPSGCGKTTLLQFLAGNKAQHRERLKIIGLREPKVAFIGQDDCLLPGLTARETLIYASRLQNSNKQDFDHAAHVVPIIEALGLGECADRQVTKLSGGQAKRVTIAQELLYPTNLLILDEVTSGLDASTSFSIVSLLKGLVSDRTYPMSIVMSIHQPSAKLFSVFDKVYVMSAGQCLYEGSCRSDLVDQYLSNFGLQCPKYHNIADYLIEIACSDEHPEQPEGQSEGLTPRQLMIQYQKKRCKLSAELADELCVQSVDDPSHGVALQMEATVRIQEEEGQQNHHEDDDHDDDDDRVPLKFGANSVSKLYEAIGKARARREQPILRQTSIHFARSLDRIRRSKILTYLQLITFLLLGLQLSTFYGPEIGQLSGCPQLPLSLVSFIFASTDHDSQTLEMRRIQENMNFLLVAIMSATFAALEITVITFPLEAKTVKREWRNGWYQVSSYFMGRSLADLPFQMAFVMVYALMIYSLTGQIGLWTWRFASFSLIMIMTALVAQAVGFIFGAIFMDNLPAAVFTAPLFIFPSLLFSGFFSRISQIPTYYRPMTLLSHFHYAFNSLIVTLYGYGRCECNQESLSSYHDNLQNQTSSLRDTFKSLFGYSNCNTPANDEASIEDAPPAAMKDLAGEEALSRALESHKIIGGLSSLSTSTSAPFTHLTTKGISSAPIEDALVDTMFEHMKSNTSKALESSSINDPMDVIMQKFSTKLTTMLNTQANFGHKLPDKCHEFNSYLMTEFDLHDDDLINGLLVLLIFVIVTRILCNFILSATISKR